MIREQRTRDTREVYGSPNESGMCWLDKASGRSIDLPEEFQLQKATESGAFYKRSGVIQHRTHDIAMSIYSVIPSQGYLLLAISASSDMIHRHMRHSHLESGIAHHTRRTGTKSIPA